MKNDTMVDGVFLKKFESRVGVEAVNMEEKSRWWMEYFWSKNLGQCLWGLTT
jgi:hypothetical protein